MSSAVAANAVLAQSALGQGGAGNARIPTAVIGVGNRGSYLLKGVLEQPNAKVVALCDNKPNRLDAAATVAAKDSPSTYADWRKVIDRKDIEAVFIATPPNLHSEMAIAALESGKNVYCEKPIGVTPRQVQDLVLAVQSSGKVFVAGQQMRSYTQLKNAIAKIRDGVMGKVVMVKAQRHAGGDLPYDGSSGDWYFDVIKSGGYLIEQSIHNLDACNWVIGEHPVRVSGYGATLVHPNEPAGRTIFDSGVLSYEYPSGAILSFTQNVFQPRGFPSPSQNLLAYGTKGAVDFLYSTNFYALGGDGKPVQLAPEFKDDPHAHTTAFYDCITKGAANPADIYAGATGALTAIMGHMAMVKQGTVDWIDMGVNF
ncbi:MAG: Gfo/Idh/MocA family oxidoreductase [Bryobacterales bacterium]|nr:Gfo/Idh/MocA family oxidoreductase [Bryobacterales bacterium]